MSKHRTRPRTPDDTTAHAPQQRPPACHWDRALQTRVTRRHAPDCPSLRMVDPAACPAADRGCQPCDEHHCLVCGREHTTPARPDTCVECEARIAADLRDIEQAYDQLAEEATDAAGDGRLVAAAPIPGGEAQVLRGPMVPMSAIRTGHGLTLTELRADHRPKDPMPPLAVLAQWEDLYRSWLGHTHPTNTQGLIVAWYGTPGALASRRATVHSAITYLRNQLPYIANHATTHDPNVPGAPDFVAFTHQIRDLRAALEARLHDEDALDEGVPCFECGERLVRRIRERRRCRHTTPAREHLAMRLTLLPIARNMLEQFARARDTAREQRRQGIRPSAATMAYARYPTAAEAAAALLPSPAEIAFARIPCPACAKTGLGGVDNPAAGHSWECPGCRKEYKPGEYVTAVRLDLAADQAGWPNIPNAAAAATTLTEWPVGDKTIRGWVGRGWVRSRIDLQPNGLPGLRVVFWPDVRREARRVAAGLQHCRHRTPARDWLDVLATYPEIEPWDDEVDAGYDECQACADAADQRLVTRTPRLRAVNE